MRLVIAGAGVQLQASHTNHEHIVLPMVELLKEQTHHRSIIDTIMSQQSLAHSPKGGDTMVDMTIDDMGHTLCQRSDNVPPCQLMFGPAMDELKVALLADIRTTIHSEMEPLRRQMQEFGDRLKKLESAITNSQVVVPSAGRQHDSGVT
ncbi:hypothetical protein NP493_1669g00002 [Ridgeia piscesae]|uniref:Uncharacterized protein n=1 Tax=Ridgeia piscesae TaxID=27915 RepID=A0AAD9JW68_RIDPI|nr:hypothetical protein NP493_1669g00002 [Ridgeia piscesae]